MTKEPLDDLILEWNLYSPGQQKAIVEEYKASGGDPSSKEDFLNFLRKKLETDGYWWKKAGFI